VEGEKGPSKKKQGGAREKKKKKKGNRRLNPVEYAHPTFTHKRRQNAIRGKDLRKKERKTEEERGGREKEGEGAWCYPQNSLTSNFTFFILLGRIIPSSSLRASGGGGRGKKKKRCKKEGWGGKKKKEEEKRRPFCCISIRVITIHHGSLNSVKV